MDDIFLRYLFPPLSAITISALAYWLTVYFLRQNQSALAIPAGINRQFTRANRHQLMDAACWVIVLVAWIGFTAQSIHGYDSFNSFPDMRYADNILYNILQHGEIKTYLYRFDPIMLALTPLYVIWHDPRILLIVQSAALAFSILPIYWSARRQIGRWLALGLALIFASHPSVHALNLPMFAEIKLAVPILSLAMFFLLRRHYHSFLACLVVGLLIKQEIALTAAGFGVFIFFFQRNFRLGFVLGAVGLTAAIIFVQFLYPALTGSPYPHLAGGRFSYLGTSVSQIAQTLIFNPQVALSAIWIPDKIEFVIKLMTPLTWLPLLGLDVLAISFPAWAYTLLSRETMQFNANQYYQAPLVPFMFFGTLVALQRLLNWRAGNLPWKIALSVLLLVGAQVYLPSSWQRIFDPSSFALDAHSTTGQRLLALVPNNATVVAQAEFVMPLYANHRLWVIEFNPHENYTGVDDYILEVKGDVYMFGDATRTYYKIHRSAWDYWRASGYFDTLAEQDGYFVLKRKSLAPLRTPLNNGLVLIGSPTSQFQIDDKWGLIGYMDKLDPFLRRADTRFGNELVLSGYRLVPNDTAQGGETVHTVVEWRAAQDIHTQFIMVAQVVDVNGHVWAQDSRDPVYGLVPTQHWKTGDLIRDQYTFALPVEMPPGTYRITLSVWDQTAGKSLQTYNEAQQSTGIEVVLGTITVRKNTNSIPASFLTIESPLSIDLNEIRLLGSTSIPKAIRAGDDLSLGLYWRARSKPAGDYTVVVRVRDSAEHIAFEQADRPAAGAYPTTLWQVGEILLDWHDITLPANLPAGDYTITTLLRDNLNQVELGEAKIGAITVMAGR